MIKVLHILTDTNIGGAGMLLLYLLRERDAARFDYEVILPAGAALTPRVRELGVTVTETDCCRDMSRERGAVKKYTALIKKIKPDVVHCHAAFSARAAAWLCGVPVRIMSRHCGVSAAPHDTSFLKRTLNGTINSVLSTRIVATSDNAADDLFRCGTPASRVVIIKNGVPPLRRAEDSEAAEFRARLGIPQSGFVFLFCGRLEPVKRPDVFVGAAMLAAAKQRELYFVMAGIGSMERELREKVDANGLSDRILFAGFLSDVAPAVYACNALVNSSDSETTPLATSEAMSAAKPVIVSSCPGNRDMVDGGHGMVFPCGDVKQLACLMNDMYENRSSTVPFLSRKAKERYEECYTSGLMTRRTEELYIQELVRLRRLHNED